MNIRKRNGLVVAAILFLLNLPFLTKPFHIDDVYFLEVAQNIRQHPLDPFNGNVALLDQDFLIFRGSGEPPNTFDGMSHPPLVPYFLASVISLSGSIQEVPLHLAFWIFVLIASASTYVVANRFTVFPFGATLFILGSPIFLVNSQNLMTDVPMLALFLCSLALFMNGLDEISTPRLLLAGFVAALAVLTRYFGLLIFPMFLGYALFRKKKLRETLPAFAAAALPIGAWFVQNWIYHGRLHILASSSHYARFYEHGSFGASDLLIKAISDLSGIGAVAVFVLPVLLVYGHRKVFLFVILFSAILATLFAIRPGTLEVYSPVQLLLLSFFLSSGLFLVIISIQRWRSHHDSNHSNTDHFLIFWLIVTLVPAILLLPFGTSRYMLPVLPPLTFIILRSFGGLLQEGTKPRYFLNAALCATIGLSLVLAIADERFARTYRNFPNTLKAAYPGERIWYIGEWGFRHYMNKNAYRYLLSDENSPKPGDLIVRADLAGLHWMSKELSSRCERLRTVEISEELPLRILNPEAKAGFYSHGFGLLPFSFSKAPLEHFTLFRVVR